jgi:ribosomal protein L1
MMEKYGVDLAELPVTDDQMRTIGKLAKIAGTRPAMPKNRKEADELIEKLGEDS